MFYELKWFYFSMFVLISQFHGVLKKKKTCYVISMRCIAIRYTCEKSRYWGGETSLYCMEYTFEPYINHESCKVINMKNGLVSTLVIKPNNEWPNVCYMQTIPLGSTQA